jgi:hypothetical protein
VAAENKPSGLARWGQGLGEGVLYGAQALATGGFWGGGVVAVAMGKFMLGGALAALGLGVFLRFKRLRMKRKARRG